MSVGRYVELNYLLDSIRAYLEKNPNSGEALKRTVYFEQLSMDYLFGHYYMLMLGVKGVDN